MLLWPVIRASRGRCSGAYDMNAAFMLRERHGWGIHADEGGTNDAGVTGVCCKGEVAGGVGTRGQDAGAGRGGEGAGAGVWRSRGGG